jgi:hypothetical protein
MQEMRDSSPTAPAISLTGGPALFWAHDIDHQKGDCDRKTPSLKASSRSVSKMAAAAVIRVTPRAATAATKRDIRSSGPVQIERVVEADLEIAYASKSHTGGPDATSISSATGDVFGGRCSTLRGRVPSGGSFCALSSSWWTRATSTSS